jgi:hypothetical protein
MQTGMILNAMICFSIFIFSLLTSLSIWRKKKNQADIAFAIFWLAVAITWLFVAISLMLYKYGFFSYDILLNQYGVQIAISLEIIAGIFYAVNRVTKSRIISWFITAIFCFISAISLAYNFMPGSMSYYGNSFFSVEYSMSPVTWNLFQIMFVCVILVILFDLLRNYYFWLKNKKLYEQKYLIVGLAASIYGVIGYFDQQGQLVIWISLLLRSAIIFIAGIVYLAYNEQDI